MSEITWDYLSMRQQETLQDIVLGNGAVVYDPQMKGLCNWLNGHGLVVILPNPHTPGSIMVDPTDKGREVYAQKPPAAETGAGGDDSDDEAAEPFELSMQRLIPGLWRVTHVDGVASMELIAEDTPDDSGYTELIDELSGRIKGLERKLAAAQAAHKQIVGVWKLWNDGAMSDVAAIVRMHEIAQQATGGEVAE